MGSVRREPKTTTDLAQPKDRPRTRRVGLGYLAAVAVAIGGTSVPMAASGAAGKARPTTVVVSTVKNARLGTILVSGNTVYTLKASKTVCGAQCLRIWPAVTLPRGATRATAGGGVQQSKLGTVRRAGGILQVTYGGKALYWFSGDTARGQVNGNITDTWGKWSTVVIAKPARPGSGSPGSGSPGSGSGGSSPSTGGVSF